MSNATAGEESSNAKYIVGGIIGLIVIVVVVYLFQSYSEKAKLRSAIQSVEQKIEAIQGKISNYNQEIQDAENDILSVQRKITNVMEKIGDIKADLLSYILSDHKLAAAALLAAGGGTAAALEANFEGLQGKFGAAMGLIGAGYCLFHAGECAEVGARAVSDINKINNLKEKIPPLQNDIQRIRRTQQEKQRSIDSLNTDIQKLQVQKRDLQARLNKLK